MNQYVLPLVALASFAIGCSQEKSIAGSAPPFNRVAQKRVVYDGKLDESHLPISILPAPGWKKRESDAFLSVVHTNGNVLNIGPADGPNITRAYEPVEMWLPFVEMGRLEGSDVWDFREFKVGSSPACYLVHIAAKKYQTPQGELQGEIGGDVNVTFNGFFHPGDTDLNQFTAMLKSIRIESK